MEINSKMILPIFIIVIMVFSGVGFFYTGGNKNQIENNQEQIINKETVEFKGRTFTKTENGYNYKGINLLFSLEELDKVIVNVTNLKLGDKIYLTVNDTIPVNAATLPFFSRIIEASYDDNMSLAYNLPLKDCNDAGPSTTIIKFINGDVDGKIDRPSSITQIDNCYILGGDLALVIERFKMELADE